MRKPSDMLGDILVENVFVPGRSMYLKFTTLLYEVFVVIFAITTPIFILLFFVQLDYIQNKHKLNYTALPIEKQERFNYLKKEELRLYAREETLLKDTRYDEIKESRSQRSKLTKEMIEISKEAPHSSWAYHFYVFIGVIKPF